MGPGVLGQLRGGAGRVATRGCTAPSRGAGPPLAVPPSHSDPVPSSTVSTVADSLKGDRQRGRRQSSLSSLVKHTDMELQFRRGANVEYFCSPETIVLSSPKFATIIRMKRKNKESDI